MKSKKQYVIKVVEQQTATYIIEFDGEFESGDELYEKGEIVDTIDDGSGNMHAVEVKSHKPYDPNDIFKEYDGRPF